MKSSERRVVILPSAAWRCLVSVGVVWKCLVTVRLGDDSVRGHYLPSGAQTDARGPHTEQLKPNYIHTIRSAPSSCLRHAPTHSNVFTHTHKHTHRRQGAFQLGISALNWMLISKYLLQGKCEPFPHVILPYKVFSGH